MNNATAPRTAQAVRTRAILSFTGTGEDTAAGGGEPPTWILPVASAALKYTTGRPSTMTTSDSENPPVGVTPPIVTGPVMIPTGALQVSPLSADCM